MPLLWLSGIFILGIVFGGATPLPLDVVVACLAALTAVVLRHTRLVFFCLATAALCLGFARSIHPSGALTPADIAFYAGKSVQVQGEVSQEPDIRDTGSNYLVAIKSRQSYGRSISIRGTLQLHTALSQQFEYGDRLQLTGRVSIPSNAPGRPYLDIMRARGIDADMSFPRAVDLGPAGWTYKTVLVQVRARLESGINAALPEPDAALLIAIALGAKSASLGALAPVLVRTGLIHLIAISGIKVSLVAGIIWSLVSFVRRRALTLLFSLLSLLLYVLLTGATASGERSALMWALVFLAAYFGRNTVALVSLAFVAALMVAVDPRLPWDIGFQLSTIGTLSIVAFTGRLLRFLRRVPSPFREPLAVTVAAQIGTVPIVARGFHSVSLVGPLANALVLPLLPLAILLGFGLGAFSAVAYVEPLLANIAFALTRTVVVVGQALDTSRSAWTTPAPDAFVSSAYYFVIGALMWWLLRRASWAPVGHWSGRTREIVIALLLSASIVTVSNVRAEPGDRLTFLGSGSAFLLQSNGQVALIGGSARPLAFLSALGTTLPMSARTIDLIVVTDPGTVTIQGLAGLLKHYRVGEVLEVGPEYPTRTYARWRQLLLAARIPQYALSTGASGQIGRVALRAVAPAQTCPLPARCVGMVQVSGPRHSILLTGTANAAEQEEIVFRAPSLRASTIVSGVAELPVPDLLTVVKPRSVWCVMPRRRPVSCLPLLPGHSVSWQL